MDFKQQSSFWVSVAANFCPPACTALLAAVTLHSKMRGLAYATCVQCKYEFSRSANSTRQMRFNIGSGV